MSSTSPILREGELSAALTTIKDNNNTPSEVMTKDSALNPKHPLVKH